MTPEERAAGERVLRDITNEVTGFRGPVLRSAKAKQRKRDRRKQQVQSRRRNRG
jgi:hypothetical protein